MKEDDEMSSTVVSASKQVVAERETRELEALSVVPTETLARLDRLALASVHAAGLAHEIANPLGGLLASMEMLEARVRGMRRSGAVGPDDLEAFAEDLAIASDATTAITDLIHDYQRFLRADDGASAPLTDVREAVEQAMRIARPRLRATARVDLQLRDVPPVLALPGRIVQVVLNLVLNATEALGGRPEKENLISVRLDYAAGRTLIEVSDNGPGLAPSLRERLRLGTPAASAPVGLGLTISQELVHRMGGNILISSLPEAGTTFIVSLPSAAA
jgi:signal transduction histidine kinase